MEAAHSRRPLAVAIETAQQLGAAVIWHRTSTIAAACSENHFASLIR
jgi:hypothetical protein